MHLGDVAFGRRHAAPRRCLPLFPTLRIALVARSPPRRPADRRRPAGRDVRPRRRPCDRPETSRPSSSCGGRRTPRHSRRAHPPPREPLSPPRLNGATAGAIAAPASHRRRRQLQHPRSFARRGDASPTATARAARTSEVSAARRSTRVCSKTSGPIRAHRRGRDSPALDLRQPPSPARIQPNSPPAIQAVGGRVDAAGTARFAHWMPAREVPPVVRILTGAYDQRPIVHIPECGAPFTRPAAHRPTLSRLWGAATGAAVARSGQAGQVTGDLTS